MKNSIFYYGFLTITLFSLFAFTNTKKASKAEEVDFKEILKKSDFFRGGQVPGVSWEVAVQSYKQNELDYELILDVSVSADEDRQFGLITFVEPKKYSGQRLLIRDNNMWMAKPELRQPIAISGRQRLMGSAANTDVASVNYTKDYNIIETEETTFNGKDCWVLNLEAKNSKVSYASIKYWIGKDSKMGLHSEYYGKSNKLIKVADFQYDNAVSYNNENSAFLSKVTIFDKINNEDRTELNISKVKFESFSKSKFQKSRLLD